jgi:hypothetical protein
MYQQLRMTKLPVMSRPASIQGYGQVVVDMPLDKQIPPVNEVRVAKQYQLCFITPLRLHAQFEGVAVNVNNLVTAAAVSAAVCILFQAADWLILYKPLRRVWPPTCSQQCVQ